MPANLNRVLSLVFDTPLLVDEQKLDIITAVLQARLGIELSVDGTPLKADIAPPAPESSIEQTAAQYRMVGNIAVVPVTGSLVHRAGFLDAESGMQSYASVVSAIEMAMRDRKVRAVRLECDSPGGTATGAFEAAEAVFAMRGIKPFDAVVNEQATSAMFLLASATDRIYLNPSGIVGSVGVIARLLDRSEAKEKYEGKAITVKAGEHKDTFSPPFTKEKVERIQAEVDKTYSLFVSTVARNMGLSEDAVRATKGGVLTGEDAVAAGFAHEIVSVREMLATGAVRAFAATERTKGTRRNTKMDEFKQLCQSLGIEPLEDSAETLKRANARVQMLTRTEENAKSLLTATGTASLDAVALKLDAMVPKEDLETAQGKLLSQEAETFVAELMAPANGKLIAAKKDWATERFMADPEAFKALMADAPRVVPEVPGTEAGDAQTPAALEGGKFTGFNAGERAAYKADGYSDELIAEVEAEMKAEAALDIEDE